MPTGRIFDLQRFSIHDGPGIRTTVFFKGCPLRCLWCGNPESISPKPLVSYQPEKCIACGACQPVCPEKALSADRQGRAILDRPRCSACGKCAAACDPRALEMVGRDVTTEEVMAVVLRDRRYYQSSGGGVTLSGGDPLFQPEFAEALLYEAKAADLHTCVETAGYADAEVFPRLTPLVDLWLFDLKETDPQRHVQFTSVPLPPILENLRRLHGAGAKILLRCPLIPQHNARAEHFAGIASLSAQLPRIEGVEVLPYYDLWRAKLSRLGLSSRLPATIKPPSRSTTEAWIADLRGRGVRVVNAL